jgi:transposase
MRNNAAGQVSRDVCGRREAATCPTTSQIHDAALRCGSFNAHRTSARTSPFTRLRRESRLRRGKMGPVDLAGVEQIVMDEFAIQKGHRHATVTVEPNTKRV